MRSNPQVIRTRLGQLVGGVGLERCVLKHQPGGEWMLKGTVVRMGVSGPAEVGYEVVGNSAWHTRCVNIDLRDSAGDRSLRLAMDKGRWCANGWHQPAFDGCVDVDLGWSPATNLLPIRRLDLPSATSRRQVTADWISFPDLKVQPVYQEYERIGSHRYR